MPPMHSVYVNGIPRRRVSLFRPKLEADAGMDTHVLFTRAGLDRLKRRISELVQENKAERNNFKVMCSNNDCRALRGLPVVSSI